MFSEKGNKKKKKNTISRPSCEKKNQNAEVNLAQHETFNVSRCLCCFLRAPCTVRDLDDVNPTALQCQTNWKLCMFVHEGGAARAHVRIFFRAESAGLRRQRAPSVLNFQLLD